MPRTLTLTLLALALGCYEGAPAPSDPTPAPRNDLRILGGAVECDACTELDFSIGGPDLQWVVGGSFVSSADGRVALRGSIELRRFTGDSGIVLQARASFTEPPPLGTYDLLLLTPGRPGGNASMMLEEALHVTRVAPAPEPPAPPAPPGTPPPPPPPGPPGPPPPSGTLRVTVSVSGPDQDVDFQVYADACDSDYYSPNCVSGFVSTRQPLERSVPAGAYRFLLSDIAPNCQVTGANRVALDVVADSTSELHFDVACVALGIVEVSVPVTGPDGPQGIYVQCASGECPTIVVQPSATVEVRVAPGAYVFQVSPWSLPANCQATGDVAVQVVSGARAQVILPVTCQPLGEIRVSLNAPDPLQVFRVQQPDGCDNYYVLCSTELLRTGSPATFRVPAGVYRVRLLDVPTNCQVTSPNPAEVVVNHGARSELVFDVACQ